MAAGALAVGICGAGAGRAAAEILPPAQAIADDGVFLEHIAPPAQPAAVCIVDSGVDLNPDTAGQVVYRTALDGGDPGDVAPDKHGTLMAMMAAAPINGWGMVGAAPGLVKIVSVRVEEAGETTFPFSRYARGVEACKKLAGQFDIRVISLSLAAARPADGEDTQVLADQVASARNYGLAVLAAGGNDGASSPSAPGVIAVGAERHSSARCAFSGSNAVSVLAPGCGLDGADPTSGIPASGTQQGTSEAAAITSATTAALRGYAPTLAPTAIESALGGGQSLDAALLFEQFGIDVARHPAVPSALQREHAVTRIPDVPRAVVRRSGDHVRVRLAFIPAGFRCLVTQLRKSAAEFSGRRYIVRQQASRRLLITVHLAARVRELAIRFVALAAPRMASPALTVRL